MNKQWPVRKLGDVCLVERGTVITRSTTGAGEIPVIAGGIDPAYYHDRANRPAGVITVSASGANAGFVNRWDMPIFASDCSTVLADKSLMNDRFVFYFLKSRQGYIQQELRRGAAQPHVYAKDLALLEICVPPRDEQERIVNKLDFLTSGVEQLGGLGVRRTALGVELGAALVDDLLRPKTGWVERPLNEWCAEIGTGPFGSLVHKADYKESGVPLVNPMNLKDGQIVESGIKRVAPSKAQELKRYVLRTGDVVLGRRGEMGRCAAVQAEHDGWICGTGSFFLRPSENCKGDILALWLSSREGSNSLREISSGATMDNLGNKELGLLRLALPSRPLQDDLVSRVKTIYEQTSVINVLQRRRSQLLADLRQSVLEAAFRGEL